MLSWALTFLIIALIAGVLGFVGIAGTAEWIAKVLFVIFLALFLVSLISAGGYESPPTSVFQTKHLSQVMNKALGIAMLVGGIVLSIFGINASESLSSDVSRFFSGTPTDKSMWLLFSGIVLSVAGLVLSLRRSRM
jgi:uncharacterized membrane protein YtjA (UPF0391 family)